MKGFLLVVALIAVGCDCPTAPKPKPHAHVVCTESPAPNGNYFVDCVVVTP